MFASRAGIHLPFFLLSVVSVFPPRVIGLAPLGGVTTTDSFVHMSAQSPSTLIS
ncbi:MAG: hypothetical protein NTW47_12185 [Proteobacteria bacterium]|nr:hypothetical protein [Pseudomonadota bacterium]